MSAGPTKSHAIMEGSESSIAIGSLSNPWIGGVNAMPAQEWGQHTV